MIQILFIILNFIISDRIWEIITANICAKKANYQCKECGMWSCTFPTNYRGYKIIPYEDFSNICGKFKRTLDTDKETKEKIKSERHKKPDKFNKKCNL